MLFRFLILVLIVGGSFGYYRFYADDTTKKTVQDFVANFTEKTTTKMAQTKQSFEEQKKALQATLIDLQTQATEKAEAGVDKYEEITEKIEQTRAAIEELDKSISELKGSVGLGEEEEKE